MYCNPLPFPEPEPSSFGNPSKPVLLPRDPNGQQLCQIFTHGWQFIYSPLPPPGDKAEWLTETRYPLEPRNLWRQWQNPQQLIGVRPGKETVYGLIDIDAHSPYHPSQDPNALDRLRSTLESVGLCRTVLIQSSYSGGLHLYLPLPEAVKSYDLALTLKSTLQQNGFTLAQGQLELFPNTKVFKKKGYTSYNAHRLPLQPDSGSLLLNEDGQVVSDRLSDFLQQWHHAANGNDLELLRESIQVARNQNKVVNLGDKRTARAEQWYQDEVAIIQQGWTGPGQTNELLKVLARFGIVWKGLSGEALVDYIIKTAQTAPGYAEYCHHKHEIQRRAQEWAEAAEGYYTPYCSFPNRNTKLYQSQCSLDADNIVSFNEQVSTQAQARIKSAVAQLQAEDTLPQGVTARSHLITQQAKCSRRTLYKYLELWHPDHLPELEDGTNGITGVSEIQSESLDVNENKAIAHSSTASANLVPTPPYKKVGAVANAVIPLGQQHQLEFGLPPSLKNQSKIDPPEQQRQPIDLNEAKAGIEIVDMSGAIAHIQVCFICLSMDSHAQALFLDHHFAVSKLSQLGDRQITSCLHLLQNLCLEFKPQQPLHRRL